MLSTQLKIGFIGCGNMGSCILQGLIKSGFPPETITVSAKTQKTLTQINDQFHVNTTLNNKDVVKNSDVIILCIKPNILPVAIEEIRSKINYNKQLIISIAAFVSIRDIELILGPSAKIVRAMPNLPISVGEGMTALCYNSQVQDAEFLIASTIFSASGKVQVVDEKSFDIFSTLCGSSPAIFFMLIDAMADAGVKHGLKKSEASLLIAQTMLGSAKMLAETGKHPAELKDMVCSPSGSTIEAVVELEKDGFRSSVIQAVTKCMEKLKGEK